MMRTRIVIVVGDKFVDFAAGKNVLTISQLRGLLSLPGELVLDRERILLIPGQGLSDEDMAEVPRMTTSSEVERICDLRLWRSSPRAPRQFCHKHKPSNALVSAPRIVGNETYEIDLLVDDSCELMEDHQTGQHVQGMIVAEAARQAFLSVIEAFLLPPQAADNYFVMDYLNVEYRQFIFPIPARMLCVPEEREVLPANSRFRLKLEVEQAGHVAALVSAGFTVIRQKSIARVENSLAKSRLATYVDGLPMEGRPDIALAS